MLIYMANKIRNEKTAVKKRNPITNLRRRANVLLPNAAEWRWCLYDAANSAFSLIVATTMFPVFYANFILPENAPSGAATGGVGFANSAAGLAAAFAMPLLGALADRRGARKTGVCFAVCTGCICTLLLAALKPGMTLAALAVYALAFFSFTGGNVFYDSLLVDVTERRRMDYISGLGFGIGYIGSVIPFVAVLAAMFKLGEGGAGFRFAFILTAAWWAVWSLPLLLGGSGAQKGSVSAAGDTPLTVAALWRTARDIWRDRNLRTFLCAYFLYIDGVDTLIVMAVPYGDEVGLGTTVMIAVILGIQVVAFPCAMLYGVLASRFGAKRMIGVGISCYGVTVLIASLMPMIPSRAAKIALFMVLALIVAANQGGIQALSRSCYGKLIPPERAAEYFGFYNIFGKFAAVMGPALIGISGLLLGGGQYGMLSLLLLFIAGGWLLCRTRID